MLCNVCHEELCKDPEACKQENDRRMAFIRELEELNFWVFDAAYVAELMAEDERDWYDYEESREEENVLAST